MRRLILLTVILFVKLSCFGQTVHYIKFLHVGEQIQPVRTLTISYQDQVIPRDSVERTIDSGATVSVMTDEVSYKKVMAYMRKTRMQYNMHAGKLDFGTFRVIVDNKYWYLPYYSCTPYFKKMIAYLRKNKSDPKIAEALLDNYPWIFN